MLRVLIVDDDASLRLLMRDTLTREGMSVTEAPDTTSGLEVLRNADDPFDILVSDISMPQIGGGRFAREARGIFPSLPILFVSGGHEDDVALELVSAKEAGFLVKPFRPTEFVDAIVNFTSREHAADHRASAD